MYINERNNLQNLVSEKKTNKQTKVKKVLAYARRSVSWGAARKTAREQNKEKAREGKFFRFPCSLFLYFFALRPNYRLNAWKGLKKCTNT